MMLILHKPGGVEFVTFDFEDSKLCNSHLVISKNGRILKITLYELYRLMRDHQKQVQAEVALLCESDTKTKPDWQTREQ